MIFLGTSGISQTHQFISAEYDGHIASTSTQIDDRLSSGNVTILSGETAMLACKIYNLGNKSVRFLFINPSSPDVLELQEQRTDRAFWFFPPGCQRINRNLQGGLGSIGCSVNEI